MAECVVSLPTDQAQFAMTDQYIADRRAELVPLAHGVTSIIALYSHAVKACQYRVTGRHEAIFESRAHCTHPQRPSCGLSCPISGIEAYRTRLSPYVQGV